MKFLINTFTHWEEPPRARHQVALALAKNHAVVFVAANKVGFPGIKTYSGQKNLSVVQPRFFVGNKIRYRIPLLNEFYQNWLYKKLKKKPMPTTGLLTLILQPPGFTIFSIV